MVNLLYDNLIPPCCSNCMTTYTPLKKGRSLVVITFCLMSCMESVRKMEEVGSEALILDFGPCSAGKKVE